MDKLRTVGTAPIRGLLLGALTLPVLAQLVFSLLCWGPILGIGLVLRIAPPIEAVRGRSLRGPMPSRQW